MALHNEIGKEGEQLAAELLCKKGYKILERNWRYNGFEIDIIAKNKKEIVFVEVKTRTSTDYGRPEEAVDFQRRRRMKMAALIYTGQNQINLSIRYDVISVIIQDGNHTINHIENAFANMVDSNYVRKSEHKSNYMGIPGVIKSYYR